MNVSTQTDETTIPKMKREEKRLLKLRENMFKNILSYQNVYGLDGGCRKDQELWFQLQKRMCCQLQYGKGKDVKYYKVLKGNCPVCAVLYSLTMMPDLPVEITREIASYFYRKGEKHSPKDRIGLFRIH